MFHCFITAHYVYKNGGISFSTQKECKATSRERKEMDQEKMQGSGQFEIGGALGRITTLLFSWEQHCCVHVTCTCTCIITQNQIG